MKTILQLEDAAKALVAYWFTIHLGYSWWLFWAWFLAPDLSMIGYAVNARVGAWMYNFFHHQAVALAVGLYGFMTNDAAIQFAGALLFGHSATDRVFGYGLKLMSGFKYTHLGTIGQAKSTQA